MGLLDMRHVKKADKNQAQIVADLRKCGFTVYDFHKAGYGVPDLIVIKSGVGRWVEVKSRYGALSKAERIFRDICPGPPVIVARTTEDVLDAFECIQLDELWIKEQENEK